METRLLQFLQQNGGEMVFAQFVIGARAAGLKPEHWLQAKHAGLVVTEQRGDTLFIRPAAAPPISFGIASAQRTGG